MGSTLSTIVLRNGSNFKRSFIKMKVIRIATIFAISTFVTVIRCQEDKIKNATEILRKRLAVPSNKSNTNEKDEIGPNKQDNNDSKIKVSVRVVDPNMSPKQRLRNHLMLSYNKEIHPVLDYREPVNVHLGMALIHVDFDEKKSLITVDGWMRMTWNDPNLAWNPDDFENVTQMHFGSNELWKPDILLYNNADSANVNHYGVTHCLVDKKGDVLWVPPGHFKAYCKLKLKSWPFDAQTCQLKFGSWTSHGNQIDLHLYRNSTTVEKLNLYTNNREWKIVREIVAEKRDTYYQCCDEPYPDVTFTFELQRDSPGYRAIIVLPCLVIMLMTGCSFLLTPTSGEKLIINAIAILASILYLLYFAMTIPFTQNDIPIIVTFYSNITALIGIAVLLNVVCMSMARERKYNSPPKFLKNAFSGYLGQFLCLGNYYHQVSSTHQRLTVELTDMAESEQQQTEQHNMEVEGSGHDMQSRAISTFHDHQSYIMRDWVLVAAGLERLFFTIYAMAFGVITAVYI